MLATLSLLVLQAPLIFSTADGLVVDNGLIRLTVDRRTGRYDLAWGGATGIKGIAGEARLDAGFRRTDDASRHEIETQAVKDAFGVGTRVTVRHLTPGRPELRHVFWIYRDRAEAIVRLDLVGGKGTNGLTPIVTQEPVQMSHVAALRSLFVPWDNDAYVRYRSDGWTTGADDGSWEVGAVWDDATRHGLVVGSLDHDLWKTTVGFRRDGGLRVLAGSTGKSTHDLQPHGTVTGHVVSSPRIAVGRYDDWRSGLERFGDLNALVRSPLPWSGGVPFGWNSWSGHKSKVSAADVRAATDFVADDLPSFRSGGTAYVNFDSFWDNLKREERVAFVRRVHAKGLKAGIYWTPFVNWGEPDWKVGGDARYLYRDLALKDANGAPLPKLDGGWPLDPTHPGTLARIDRQLREFVEDGYDFVKLDFLSHGALEGAHHDRKVPTGTAAYAVGMRRIVEDLSPARIGRPFFISLSIAPLFPHGFAHSRRVSCDVFANIGASEYLMNSANYAWWEAGRLYRFNDPDSACVYQPKDEPPVTEAEARTRFTASVVAGGMMIEGDDLTKPEARVRVLSLFRNAAALDVARRASPFRPVDGDTDDRAGDAFVRIDGKAAYVAAFNYDKLQTKRRTLSRTRLGLPSGSWTVRDLWTGAERPLQGDLVFDLPPMGCALVCLTSAP